MLATMPVVSSSATLTMAAREKRGTTTASAATRLPGSVAAASTSRPSSPPIQIDAAARCAQSSASISPTGLVVAGWPARPGKRERGRGAAAGADDARAAPRP